MAADLSDAVALAEALDLLAAGKAARAIGVVDRRLNEAPKSPLRPELLLVKVRASIAIDRHDDALAVLRRMNLAAHPRGAELRVLERITEGETLPAPHPEALQLRVGAQERGDVGLLDPGDLTLLADQVPEEEGLQVGQLPGRIDEGRDHRLGGDVVGLSPHPDHQGGGGPGLGAGQVVGFVWHGFDRR